MKIKFTHITFEKVLNTVYITSMITVFGFVFHTIFTQM